MPFDLDESEYRATRILTGADKVDDINVGEYLYNRYNGIITTYKKINEKKYICLETGFTVDLDHQLILGKTSENIIDLTEVDDYVNGRKVKHIRDYEDFKRLDFDDDMDDTIYEEQIYSIVTKEQFKSVEYKVGG